jgi:hypothetical protein
MLDLAISLAHSNPPETLRLALMGEAKNLEQPLQEPFPSENEGSTAHGFEP